MTLCWIGCGARRGEHATCSLCAPALSFAAQLVCLGDGERLRTGALFIYYRTSAQFPSMNAWSSMGTWFALGALPPVSTAHCALRRRCAAIRLPRLFNCRCSTRRNPLSTAGLPRLRRQPSSNRHSSLLKQSRRSDRGPPNVLLGA